MITSWISGTLVGRIWWPGEECQKHVKINLNDERSRQTEWAGSLRYLVVRAVSDGDFRSCSFTGDSDLIVQSNRYMDGKTVTRTKVIPLTKFKCLSDCIAKRRRVWAS